MQKSVRKLSELKSVLKNPEAVKKERVAYTMYRGIFRKNGYRYDETTMPALLVGDEYVKTKGHSHVCPEMYIVLEGEALFLLQDENRIFAFSKRKGEMIIIQPNILHTTINPGKSTLVLGNWIQDIESDYSFFERMSGAAFYYTTNEWVKNEKYENWSFDNLLQL